MNSIAQKYNRILILIFAVAPFVAFFTVKFLNMDFNRMMQLMSYIGVFLLLILRNNKTPIKFPKYLFFYLLFIVYVFYSDLYRLNREFKVMYLFSNFLIGGFNMMFIIENLHFSKEYYRKIISVSKIIFLIAIIVIFIQQVVESSFFVNSNLSAIRFVTEVDENKSRLVSIYSWIGGLIVVGFASVPIYLLIVEERIKSKYILFWVISGFIFAFLTKARWIMINTLLVFIILFIHNKSKMRFYMRYIIVLPTIIILTSIILEYSGVQISDIIKERILESDKRDISQKSAGTRILAFLAFNRLFWDQPVFGVGSIKYGMGGAGKQDYKLRSFLQGRSSQMHVGYVSLLYMYGSIGGGIFLIFLFLLLKKLYQNAKLSGMWAPFLGIFGFAVANLTLVSFSIFQMGFVIVLATDKYYYQNLKYKSNRIV